MAAKLARENLKIVQLVTRNCVGGVQLVAQTLDTGFRSAGHDASIWFFCDTEEPVPSMPNSVSLFSTRPEWFYYPRMMGRLLLRLLREKPDAVIAHTTNTAVPGLVLAFFAGVKKRMAVQHNPLDTYSPLARRADWMCANLRVYWRNISVANTVRRTMAHYSAKAEERVHVIYNGIRWTVRPSVLTAEERAAARRRFGLPEKMPLVVAIGRLAEQKNYGVLIEAMALLEGVTLAIAGDGPLREELRAKIAAAGLEERVRMLGPLEAHDVRLLLRASAAFVAPSHFEAMPMIVLEAMQESAVIVASDIEAHRELLTENGLLVQASAGEISSALRRLLDDPALCARLSQGAAARVQHFSEDAMVSGYLQLLEGD